LPWASPISFSFFLFPGPAHRPFSHTSPPPRSHRSPAPVLLDPTPPRLGPAVGRSPPPLSLLHTASYQAPFPPPLPCAEPTPTHPILLSVHSSSSRPSTFFAIARVELPVARVTVHAQRVTPSPPVLEVKTSPHLNHWLAGGSRAAASALGAVTAQSMCQACRAGLGWPGHNGRGLGHPQQDASAVLAQRAKRAASL
jgi:hypothetical protein